MREWYQREDLSDKTVLDEKHLNGMLYDKAPQEKTYEGKFQFLNKLCRDDFVLTPQLSVTLSNHKPERAEPGYHRPKVPVKTMQ